MTFASTYTASKKGWSQRLKQVHQTSITGSNVNKPLHLYSQLATNVTRSAKRALIAFPIVQVWQIITPDQLNLSSCNYTLS